MSTKKPNQTLTIAWLYPDLMNTYADRGNIIVLEKRCTWRGITPTILKISINDDKNLLKKADLIFMGGAQDTQQEIVNDDLFKNKGPILKEKVENGTPGLFICGAYQFLGKYYITADNKKLPGLGIFPMYTKNPGNKRLIGNIAIMANSILHITGSKTDDRTISHISSTTDCLVGFENHGGRTYLDDASFAFAKVVKGHGNNGEDGTEGIQYKNSIGSYLHGPILPKNPELADQLIQQALIKKYNKNMQLSKLDDTVEKQAKLAVVKYLNVQV